MSSRTPRVPIKVPLDRPSRFVILAWGVVLTFLLGLIGKNLFDHYERSALFEAAEKGDDGRLQAILRLGVDPNLTEHGVSYERCSLLLAARNGQWSTVHLLLQAGANADVDYFGEAALEHAVRFKNAGAVRELLQHHVNPNPSIMSPRTVLEEAVAGGQEPIVTALLEAGADPNLCASSGLGAAYNRLDLVKLLVAHGANINVRAFPEGQPVFREGGNTPLMTSVQNGNKEIVQFLLARGALPNVKWTPFDPSRYSWKSPLRVAVQSKRQDIAALLRRAGAKE